MSVKAIVLFLQAAVLLVQYLRERELVGLGREQAMQELKDLLRERVDAAAEAREAPDDPGTDPNDRASR